MLLQRDKRSGTMTHVTIVGITILSILAAASLPVVSQLCDNNPLANNGVNQPGWGSQSQ